MSEPSKTGGYWEQTKGAVKETWGSMTGNQQMEAEGRAQNLAGKGEVNTAGAQQELKGTNEQLSGRAKQTMGGATGDTSMQTSGSIEETKGNIRKSMQ